ncbi:MAG TPA: hypothetical protein VM425_20610 [Myxococcota bacterium]|nr:hypothetical protein [Myxococcota bacterium]
MKQLMGLLIVLMMFGCTKRDEHITKADETASQVSTPKEIPVTSRSDEAIDAYRKGRELSEHAHRAEAIKELEKAVELDPGFAQALALLGSMKIAQTKNHHGHCLSH